LTNYAVTATPRVIWEYVSVGIQHRIQVRRPRDEGVSGSLVGARATFTGLISALHALLPTDFAWVNELYIAQDDDSATATGYTGPGSIVGLQDPADYTSMKKVTGTTFVGKGAHAKTKLTIFGVFWDMEDPTEPASNGRVTPAEEAAIGACITVLNSSARTYAIDNSVATFSNYANIKVNDDLLGKIRRGTIG